MVYDQQNPLAIWLNCAALNMFWAHLGVKVLYAQHINHLAKSRLLSNKHQDVSSRNIAKTIMQ